MRKSILVYLLILTATLFALPIFAQDIKQGLIAYWSFDGDAKDSSGNKNDGTINGSPAFVPGKFGKAISFDGAGDYVAVKNNDDLKLKGGAFTVSAYVNANDTKHGDILYHGLGCSTWASWFLGMQGAEPDAALLADNFVFGVRTANGAAYTSVATDAIVGEWVHVVATSDGSSMKLYINGVMKDSIDTKDKPYDSQEQLFMGGDSGCGGRAWFNKGQLDEVRLYNRALSDKEVAILKDGGLAVEPSSKLAATWGEIKEK